VNESANADETGVHSEFQNLIVRFAEDGAMAKITRF
jgi:hypothetical protein